MSKQSAAQNLNDTTPVLAEGARPLKRAGLPEGAKTTSYIKLRALKDTEVAKGNQRALLPNDMIVGTFVKSFVDEMYGKTNYVISTGDNSEVVIPGSGNLNSRMAEVTPGSYVEITYRGKSEMTSGKFKGTMAHNFQVDYEQI